MSLYEIGCSIMYDLSNWILEWLSFMTLAYAFLLCLVCLVLFSVAMITWLEWANEDLVARPMQGGDDAIV